MKLKLIIPTLLLPLTLTFSFAGNLTINPDGNDYQDKLNWKDDQGRKQGHWIVLGKDQPEKGYPPEGKVEEGSYLDNRKDGFWTKYFSDGVTPRLKGEYDFGRPKGEYTKYAENGTPIEVGTFEQGKYTGTLKRYYPDGTLKYEANFSGDGKENGKVVYYHPNGKVEFEYNSNNGVITGPATRYWPNGDIKENIVFDASGNVQSTVEKAMVSASEKIETVPVATKSAPAMVGGSVKSGSFNGNGYNKVYNKNDDLWMDGDFKSGKLYDGKVYIYDKDGLLEKIEVYKKGHYHSDGQL
jgi:antitoxin component YwqK of YwqJK toxin-antitoxin module